VGDSLSKNEYNDIRYEFTTSFLEEEKHNSSLKLYMDINRYALALRSKLNNEKHIYTKLKSEINFRNLNWKQKLFLNFPNMLLRWIKQLQRFLIKKRIYLTAFK